jgi:hypothetical protein
MDSANPAEHFDGVLHIEEVSSDTKSPTGSDTQSPTGSDTQSPIAGPRSRTLAEWREYFDEHGYSMIGPTGKTFDISLDPWSDRDENTLLAVYVKFIDPALVGTIDPSGRPPRR